MQLYPIIFAFFLRLITAYVVLSSGNLKGFTGYIPIHATLVGLYYE